MSVQSLSRPVQPFLSDPSESSPNHLAILVYFLCVGQLNRLSKTIITRTDQNQRRFHPFLVPGVIMTWAVGWLVFTLSQGLIQHLVPEPTGVTLLLPGSATILLLAGVFLSVGFEGFQGYTLEKNLRLTEVYPVTATSTVWLTLVETTLFSPLWLVFLPFFLAVARHFGYWWSSPFWAIGGTSLMMLTIAMMQTILTIVNWKIVPSGWRQPGSAFLAALGFGLSLSLLPVMIGSEYATSVVTLLKSSFFQYLAPGLVVKLMASGSLLWVIGLCLNLAGLLGFTALTIWVANRNQWLRRFRTDAGASVQKARAANWPYPIKVVIRRPQQLIQALLPALAFVPLFLLPELRNLFIKAPVAWGVLSYLIGLFALVSSVPRMITNEGRSVWRWYTYPRSIMGNLFKGSFGWLMLAMVVSGVPYVCGLVVRGKFVQQDVFPLLTILVGLPLVSVVCLSAAVLGTDPPTDEKPARLKPVVITFAITFSVLSVASFVCPLWIQAAFWASFAFFTLGWWVAADLHLAYFLEGQKDTAGLVKQHGHFKRLGLMFFSPEATFHDLKLSAAPLVPILILCGVSFLGTKALESAVPYSRYQIEWARAELVLEQSGTTVNQLTPQARKDFELQVKGNTLAREYLEYYLPFLFQPAKVFLIAAFFFTACIVLGGSSQLSLYISVTAYSYLTVSVVEYVISWVVVTLKRPELPELVKGGYIARNLAFLATDSFPVWALDLLQGCDVFSLMFILLAGYGLSVVHPRKKLYLVPVVLWIGYLGSLAILLAFLR